MQFDREKLFQPCGDNLCPRSPIFFYFFLFEKRFQPCGDNLCPPSPSDSHCHSNQRQRRVHGPLIKISLPSTATSRFYLKLLLYWNEISWRIPIISVWSGLVWSGLVWSGLILSSWTGNLLNCQYSASFNTGPVVGGWSWWFIYPAFKRCVFPRSQRCIQPTKPQNKEKNYFHENCVFSRFMIDIPSRQNRTAQKIILSFQ